MKKDAPVRSGVKPAEFLRVRKCYRSKPEEGFCIHQAEILATLRLPCRFLRKDAESSLLLFYQPDLLQETLRNPVIRDSAGSPNTCQTPCRTGVRFSLRR